jgi:hypothetical protein
MMMVVCMRPSFADLPGARPDGRRLSGDMPSPASLPERQALVSGNALSR